MFSSTIPAKKRIISGDGDPEQPRYAATQPGGKFLGTVLTPVPIFRYPSDTQREIGPGDLILDTESRYYVLLFPA